jgi:hypothetical protein
VLLQVHLEGRLLPGIDRGQHIVRGLSRGDRRVRPLVARPDSIGRVTRRGGVDGVVHGQVHHGERARCGKWILVPVVGGNDLLREAVPVEYQVRLVGVNT